MPTIEERALQQAAAAWLVAGCPPPRSLEGFKTNYRATCIALCRAIDPTTVGAEHDAALRARSDHDA